LGFSLLGALFIFVFFPVLAFEIDNTNPINNFNRFIGPLCVILSMGAGTIASIAISIIFNNGGNLRVRDIGHSLIISGISCGSASYFITNPTFAIVIGIVASFIQIVWL
jgi:hypothetical protein